MFISKTLGRRKRLPHFSVALLVAVDCFGQSMNLGRPLAAEDVRAFDITIAADGSGLPPGRLFGT